MGAQDGPVPGAAATADGASGAEDPGGTPVRGPRDGRLLAGRYLLGERLGRGGMGTVWQARDQMLDREVAVKELSVRNLPEEDLAILQSRMKQEARAAARIKHPGVITIHDVLDFDGRPWIVMELIDGRSLADVIAQEGTLLPRDAARVGAQVLAALHAGHQAGVLHRDVKPANVLLERGTGRVVLTDFGIATFEGSEVLTRPGDLVGSPDYLAPERAQGYRPGPESDLWALGATLYAAVEGDSPFRRPSPLSTMAAVVGEPLPEPRRAGALAPVLKSLMEKEPQDRPSADEARRLLEGVAAGHTMGISRVPPAALRTPTESVPLVDRNDDPNRYAGAAPTPAAGSAAAAGPGRGGGAAPAPFPMPGAGDRSALTPGTVHRARRGRIRLRPLLIAVLVAALLGGGGAAYVALNPSTSDDSGAAAPQARPEHTAGPAGPSGAGAAAPAGYVWTDDAGGFRFLLPDGESWARTVDQGQIDYSPDRQVHYLRFSVTAGQTETPLEHAQEMEQRVRQSNDYQLQQMVANTFKGHEGAVWEFTYEGLQKPWLGPRHVIEQLYRDSDGTEYAIYLSYPEEDWLTGQQRFTTIRNSFEPAADRR